MQAYQNEQTKSQRESTAANALAMIIVGIPLYLYHWRVIKKDKGDIGMDRKDDPHDASSFFGIGFKPGGKVPTQKGKDGNSFIKR